MSADSALLTDNRDVVYVRLLGEGTRVFRPVKAEPLGPDTVTSVITFDPASHDHLGSGQLKRSFSAGFLLRSWAPRRSVINGEGAVHVATAERRIAKQFSASMHRKASGIIC
jgi:hypothetical protein